MSQKRYNSIAVDAMGGDNAPNKVLKGCEIFLDQIQNINLVIFGKKSTIENRIKKNYLNQIEIIDCDEIIMDDDKPLSILRTKKDSSMRKALEYIKSNLNIGFVSSGNTGALMALSKIILGTLDNIDRPAICSLVPTTKGSAVMLDLGANKDCNEKHILQFSIMGHAFAKINRIENPKIAILNIGTEETKGKEYLQEGSNLIINSFLKENFVGFIEADDITSGKADVIVTDGFTGNISLKTAEGLSKFMMNNFKEIFTKNILNKIAYMILKNDLAKFSRTINPTNYNGAIFLGLNGVVVKSHGSASPTAFAQALRNCLEFINGDINKLIYDELKMVNFIND